MQESDVVTAFAAYFGAAVGMPPRVRSGVGEMAHGGIRQFGCAGQAQPEGLKRDQAPYLSSSPCRMDDVDLRRWMWQL